MLLFFFNHAATAEISPLSLHDALPSCPVQPPPVAAPQPLDVLDPLLARELQRQVELALEVVVGRPRHDHPARLGQLLQARGDVPPPAVEGARRPPDHVPEGYARSGDEALRPRHPPPPPRHPPPEQ